MNPKKEKKPCIDCGQKVPEFSVVSDHKPGCPHWKEALTKAELALIDVLDGTKYWEEVRDQTGLSDWRCQEIFQMYLDLSKRFNGE